MERLKSVKGCGHCSVEELMERKGRDVGRGVRCRDCAKRICSPCMIKYKKDYYCESCERWHCDNCVTQHDCKEAMKLVECCLCGDEMVHDLLSDNCAAICSGCYEDICERCCTLMESDQFCDKCEKWYCV